MENKKFSTKQLLIAGLAGALAYSLFGGFGLLIVALYYVYKMV